jgi:hypothetical protein
MHVGARRACLPAVTQGPSFLQYISGAKALLGGGILVGEGCHSPSAIIQPRKVSREVEQP